MLTAKIHESAIRLGSPAFSAAVRMTNIGPEYPTNTTKRPAMMGLNTTGRREARTEPAEGSTVISGSGTPQATLARVHHHSEPNNSTPRGHHDDSLHRR